MNDKYKAGIWRRNLPRSLLWFASYSPTRDQVKPSPFSKLQSKHTVPTWFWASSDDHAIRMADGGKNLCITPIATVLDVFTEASESNTYGEVHSGYLQTYCPLRHAFSVSILDAFSSTGQDESWIRKLEANTGTCFFLTKGGWRTGPIHGTFRSCHSVDLFWRRSLVRKEHTRGSGYVNSATV